VVRPPTPVDLLDHQASTKHTLLLVAVVAIPAQTRLCCLEHLIMVGCTESISPLSKKPADILLIMFRRTERSCMFPSFAKKKKKKKNLP
jgi:hypothetical protein